MASALAHCRRVCAHYMSVGGFDTQALSGLKVVSVAKGNILCELQLEKQHLNHLGGCHGGLLSTIVDVGGSLAIANEDMFATGVSTDLNVSFISGAKIGEKLSIFSKCDKIGGSLAYTSVEISVGERLVALGRHTKFVRHAHQVNAKQKESSGKQ
ncbi:hypothetical protein BGZ76_004646 [Entomortierella beljakovae]|nr:hypothetical protein BGZ76_004646 [Entomortierella beljakovae]